MAGLWIIIIATGDICTSSPAIATTVAGIMRSEIGKMELDSVQSNRADLIAKVREQVAAMVDDWGIEVTRAEVLDVNLDDATRAAMLQQLNAQRARFLGSEECFT